MKKNIIKIVFAFITLGGAAHAQVTDTATRARANREFARAMRDGSWWVLCMSNEPEKSPLDGKKPTVAPVYRDTADMSQYINAMRDSNNWIHVSNPVMDSLPVINGNER